jgi:HK97 family phage prohead protease
MAQRSVTREVPQLTLRAALSPDTLDEEKRTVDLVWTTGARVLRGWFDQFWEELSLDPKHVRMDRLNGGAPLLDSHNGYDLGGVIGVVESARLEKGKGVATVRFAKAEDDPEADKVFRKVKDGIIRNVSVGYRIHKMEKVSEKEGEIPVYRAVDWTPHEISIVPVGADAGAGVRSEQATNPCEFVAQERTMEDEKPTTTATTSPATQPAAADVQRAAADAERERAAERERVLGIQRRGAALGRPQAEIDEAIRSGAALDAFTATAVDKRAAETTLEVSNKRSTETIIGAGDDSRDKWLRGAMAWVIQRAAVGDVVAEHAKKTGEKVDLDAGEFRGLRMLDLARMSLERSGVRTAGMLPMDVIGQALTHRTASGPGAGTSDFPVLLENTLHKVLLAAYATTPDTWTQFCATGSVSDFRAHPRYRLGSFSSLSTLNEGGEFVNKSIPDATKESITAGTKGNIIGITRKALINDDLGAFSRLATMLGRAARLSIEVDTYALLALNAGLGPTMNDGLTLFHASHNNISTGAALSADAIDADRVKMASQTDPSGNEILDLRPHALVLPVGLGGKARQINSGQYDFDATSKYAIPNKVMGLFSVVVDTPRMTGTRRYLFANPAIAPTIEVAFLDGQQMPFMDMMNGWRIDGVEWKVRIDYAVGAIDFRGAVTNAGV